MPEGSLTILHAFADLRAAAGRQGMSDAPVPIRYADIEAWQATMRVPLHPDEVRAIRALDEARAGFEAEMRTKPATQDDED